MKYIGSYGSGGYEEKKSRFIGEVFPVHREEEVQAQLNAVRKKYYDARHHCYAYVIGPEYQIVRQSDDGEPSQTAGLPILNVLKGAEIHDALLVVTRYFGGTLLGTGGLVRSYTAAARAALENADILTAVTGFRAEAEIGYELLQRLRYLAEGLKVREEKIDYLEKVRISWLVPAEAMEKFQKQVQEASGGSVVLAISKAQWYNS